MASLNLTRKTHTLIDIAAGLLIGWYRVRIPRPGPARNPDAHYIYSKEMLDQRLNRAKTEIISGHTMAIMQSAAELLHGINNPVICDFGGAYGEDCIRLRRFIPDAACTVVEIPEIVDAAGKIDELKPIAFATVPPPSCDLFLSCGVVMNAHDALFKIIEQTRPPRLIITSVEITEGPTYWSLVVYRKTRRRCPYITFNRNDFIRRFEDMGYVLNRSWNQGENNSGVFLNGQGNPNAYSFVFLRSSDAASL